MKRKTFRQVLAEKLVEEKINKTLNDMEITDEWKKLKRDAMASFIMTGLAANPSFAYLKPDELATKAIQLADELDKQLNTEINPL
jgi:predicted RNA-binding protein with EMAP domain